MCVCACTCLVFKLQDTCVVYLECKLRPWALESDFLHSNLGSATLWFVALDKLLNLNTSVFPSLNENDNQVLRSKMR